MKKSIKKIAAQLLIVSMMLGQVVSAYALETETVINESEVDENDKPILETELNESVISNTNNEDMQTVSTEITFGTFNVDVIGNGNIEVNLTGIEPQSEVKGVKIFVWTAADKSDGKWYGTVNNQNGNYHTIVDISDYEYSIGSYCLETYAILNDGTEYQLDSRTVQAKIGAKKIEIEKNVEETKFEIRLEGLETQGQSGILEAAVWSDEDWQDDLRWYPLSKVDESYICSVDLNQHKSVGIYYIDIYFKSDNGRRYILKSQKMSVEKVQPGTLNIQVEENGQARISLVGIDLEQSVERIEMKVWPAQDENAVYWYETEKIGSEEYVTVANLVNHQYDTGLYCVDVYVTAKNGACYYLQGATYTLDLSATELELKLSKENTVIEAGLYGLKDYSIAKEIQFAVWSAENGQDDLKWYIAKQSGNKWICDIDLKNHKSIGVYYVDAYVFDKNGKKHFVKSNLCTINKIPKGIMRTSEDGKGNISIALSDIKNAETIDKIEVAVWSDIDWQDDLKWYTAQKDSAGTYTVDTNLKNHKYSLGLYYIDVYVTMKNGARYYLQGDNCKINISSDKLELRVNKENTIVEAALYGLEDHAISKEIRFAVWSAENGQDDLKWYTAKKSGDLWTCDINLKNHKSTGIHYVDAYAIDKSGKKHFIKSNLCVIAKVAKGTMTMSEDGKGNISIALKDIKNQELIDKIEVAVWSKEDWQDDLKWYVAQKDSAGTYTVNTNLKNHKYSIGDYYADAYIIMKNGAKYCLQGATQTIKITVSKFENVPTSAKDMTRIRATALATHGVADRVKVAVWSAKNGQDDLYWYDMDLVQGNYEAWVEHYKHKDTGKYYADLYVQDSYGKKRFVKSLVFDVDTLPKDRVVVSNYQMNKGTFDVYVYVQNAPNTIKSVKIPVWVSSDHSDIYWYQGIRQSDGSYKATVNVKNHKYHSGKYIIDSYVQDTAGLLIYIRNTSLEVTAPIVISKAINDGRECRITISGIDDRTVTEVSFPTWSADKGQDDIVWYRGTHNSDGSWTAVVNTKNHKSLGEYITHIYAKINGVNTYLGKPDNYTLTKRFEGTWQWINGYKRYINMNGQIDTDVSRLVTGPYLIKVYKWSNYLIVFAKDEYGNYTVPVKAMITSCGNNTPTGTYYSPMKFRWLTMVGGSKAQWCTQISGDYLFHSVPYRIADPTTLYTDLMYNYLGTTQSLGCIRLQAGDAKWLYDNCDLGTEIYITPWESEGPIAKPAFSPIPSWHTWDPTDPTVRYLCKERGCH